MEKNSEGYLLSVTTTRLLRGGEQTWSGEQVRVKPEYLALPTNGGFLWDAPLHWAAWPSEDSARSC